MTPRPILALLLALLPAAAHARFDPGRMREDRSLAPLPRFDRNSTFRATDLDGDGRPELLVGTWWWWAVLEHAGGASGYAVRFLHENPVELPRDDHAADYAVGDVDGDGALEVVVLMASGRLYLHDPWTGAQRASRELGAAHRSLALADIHPAPGEEVVAVNPNGLNVFHFSTPGLLWGLPGAGGYFVAVGQVDSDLALEAVLSSGKVVDLAARAEEWTVPATSKVALGDLDGDGRDEAVLAPDFGDIVAYDIDTRSQMWIEYSTWNPEPRLIDLDGDGRLEVLSVGSGDLIARDGLTGAELWSRFIPSDERDGADAADLDGDCRLELVYGGDAVTVADLATGAVKWQSPGHLWPWALAVADFDQDGSHEALQVYGDGNGPLVGIADLRQHQYRYLSPARLQRYDLAYDVAVGQHDADGPLEYVITDPLFNKGRVSAFDGVSHARDWSSPALPDERVTQVESADVDGDGSPEVLIATDAFPGTVRILDGRDGRETWKSPGLSSSVDGLAVGDVDGDGLAEIAVFTRDGLVVYDGLSHAEEWSAPWDNVSALRLDDVDGDGDADILIGDLEGTVTVLDGSTKALMGTSPLGSWIETVWAIRVADLDGDGEREIVSYQEDQAIDGTRIRVLRSSTMFPAWESVGIRAIAPGLEVVDADDDGKLEIVVGSEFGVRSWEYDDLAADVMAPILVAAHWLTAAPVPSLTCCTAVDLAWSEASDGQSPPVEYRVYRDVVPGFTPGPATLRARTLGLGYRDVEVEAGVTYYYVVRAADSAGNEEDNLVERSATAGDDTLPPDQGNVIRAVRWAGDVRLEFPGAPAGAWRVYRDGEKGLIGATALGADLGMPEVTDGGAVGLAGNLFYALRGLSPCTGTPGL